MANVKMLQKCYGQFCNILLHFCPGQFCNIPGTFLFFSLSKLVNAGEASILLTPGKIKESGDGKKIFRG
jgi:hypothetical protein